MRKALNVLFRESLKTVLLVLLGAFVAVGIKHLWHLGDYPFYALLLSIGFMIGILVP